MSWRRSPLLVWASLICLFFFLACVLVLIPAQKGNKSLLSAKIIQLKSKETTELPADFGSLGDLVPFSGGIDPMSADMRLGLEEHTPEFRGADWLRSQPAEQFTIQVMAARDLDSIKKFLEGREDRNRFSYFQSQRDDGLWYVLVTGNYSSLELARGVADSMEFNLVGRPFPKSFQVFQDSIPGEQDLAPVPAPVPPSSSPDRVKGKRQL